MPAKTDEPCADVDEACDELDCCEDAGLFCNVTNVCELRSADCVEAGEECDGSEDCCEDMFCTLAKKCRPKSYIALYVTIGVIVLALLVAFVIIIFMKSSVSKNHKKIEKHSSAIEELESYRDAQKAAAEKGK